MCIYCYNRKIKDEYIIDFAIQDLNIQSRFGEYMDGFTRWQKEEKKDDIVTFAIRDPVLGRFIIYDDYFFSFEIGTGICVRFYSRMSFG